MEYDIRLSKRDLFNEIEDLENKIERLVKALTFYADTKHIDIKKIDEIADYGYINAGNLTIEIGMLAKQVLEDLK